MLWTIAVVLLILWVLGLVSSYTMGGFIHILLVIAIVVVLINSRNDPKVGIIDLMAIAIVVGLLYLIQGRHL